MWSSKDFGILLLRISMSVLLLFHGINKVFNGIGFVKTKLAENGLPEIIGYGVYIGEVMAPLLLLVGLKSRLMSFVIAINMLAAILLAKYDAIGQLTETGAWAVETPALFLLIALTLVFTGGGRYAISKGKMLD